MDRPPADATAQALVVASSHTRLTEGQAQRLTCLAVVLDLVAGRRVPIQVVERLARWAYDALGDPP